MSLGTFITVEGGEGAGKTTVIRKMEQELLAHGFQVTVTREPGGIPIAEQIRGVILDKSNTEMDSRTEALLYAAARRQHLVEKVLPALAQGHVVICDRFIDSSLAYQGHARGLGIDDVWAINQFAIDDRMPDWTLWLDVEPEIGLARIQADEGREVNRLDLEKLSFHLKVRDGYQILLERFPERIVVVDAAHSENEVWDEVQRILAERVLSKQESASSSSN